MSKIVLQRAVPSAGVGRADYSASVELSVQQLLGSHQYRASWTFPQFFSSPLPYPSFYALFLPFPDADGKYGLLVPSSPKYIIDMLSVSGVDVNALTMVQLRQYKDATLAHYIDTVAIAYGLGEAEISLTKGYDCVPGYAYLLGFCQWTLNPLMTVSFLAGGMQDRRID